MKLIAFLVLFALAPSVYAQEPTSPKELVIYTYDSIAAPGGLGSKLFPLFEQRCGCKIKALSSGDAGQLITRLQLDAGRGRPTAQIVMGLDQYGWERARPWLRSWGASPPKGYSRVVSELKLGDGFVPFDYGVEAFMLDVRSGARAPRRLSDLLESRFARNLILEDPRTSSPGLGFLLYVLAVPHGGPAFLRSLRTQWLTLANGWSAAYGLFLKNEAPLVWSYTTSQAYHQLHGDVGNRYRALVFEEGNPVQIEGAALVEPTKLARDFLEFLLSREAQERIPEGNWMLPSVEGTRVPLAFRQLPKPAKLLRLPANSETVRQALETWERAVRMQ